MSDTERETMNAVAEDDPHPTTDHRYEELADALEALADVHAVEVYDARTPPRVGVVLDVANVTPPVDDLLEAYHAVIAPESVEVNGRGALTFEVSTPERFKTAANHAVRPHGTSLVITLTRESLDLSGFSEGTELDQRAREGAILLTRREADAEPEADEED